MDLERLGILGRTHRSCFFLMCMVHTSPAVEMGMWDNPGGQQSSMWLLAHSPTNPQWAGGRRNTRKLEDKEKTITKKLFSKYGNREENKRCIGSHSQSRVEGPVPNQFMRKIC